MANSAITGNVQGLATAISPGLMGTGAQEFAGDKRFDGLALNRGGALDPKTNGNLEFKIDGVVHANAYSINSNTLAFSTGPTHTEQMRIDGAGNILFGSATAYDPANTSRKFLAITGSADSGIIQMSTAMAIAEGTNLGNIEWHIPGNTPNTRATFITSSVSGSTAGNRGSYLAFATKTDNVASSGIERMRIQSDGKVLVGITAPPANSRLFHVNDNASFSGIAVRNGTTGSWGTSSFNINWTGSAQLWIDATNVGTITLTSDYRIKRNIETLAAPALERVAQLRPVTYQMADYGELFKASEEIHEGFIAHELQEIVPSAVQGVKDDPNQIQSLKLDALVAVLTKAIQEQQAQIEQLKLEINALKGN